MSEPATHCQDCMESTSGSCWYHNAQMPLPVELREGDGSECAALLAERDALKAEVAMLKDAISRSWTRSKAHEGVPVDWGDAVLVAIFGGSDLWLAKHDERIRAEERERCAKVVEGGRFLHDDAPDARFGAACAAAIRALGKDSA